MGQQSVEFPVYSDQEDLKLIRSARALVKERIKRECGTGSGCFEAQHN
jgi:hypothetical protein